MRACGRPCRSLLAEVEAKPDAYGLLIKHAESPSYRESQKMRYEVRCGCP
jgi:hypothetical protein